jgi:hypothetical protein
MASAVLKLCHDKNYLEPAEKVKCLIFSTVKTIDIIIMRESELKEG